MTHIEVFGGFFLSCYSYLTTGKASKYFSIKELQKNA